MRFRAFGEKHIGHGHVKRNMVCEDGALSYNDPQKRFFIGAACDGHSDNNCFRSAAGARFGCESAIEVLRKFFELYYMQPAESRSISKIDPGRACRAVKQLWDRKVMADIRDNPLQDHELAPLTDKVRNYYLAGKGLNNIYGATFLAVAVCEDFFLAFHVGDGIVLCIGKDGRYYEPVTEDPRSQTGAPASLCDSDLFTRDQAFRYVLTRELPMAAVVSSDGIQDCLDDLQYIHFVHDFFARIISSELPEQVQDELNDTQKAFLMDRLAYYAGQGHGAEDDCSFAGFYDLDEELPDIRISNEIIAKKWQATVNEREHVIRDYEERKARMVRSVREQERNLEQYFEDYLRAGRTLSMFGDRRKPAASKCKEAFEKLDELVGICFTIDENERAKGRYYDARLESLRQLCNQPDQLPGLKLTPISQVGLSDHMARRTAAEDIRNARIALTEARKAEVEADKNFKAAMDHNVAADQSGSGQGLDLSAYTSALQEARKKTAQAQSALENAENNYRGTIPEKYREILRLLDSGSLPDPPADDQAQAAGYGRGTSSQNQRTSAGTDRRTSAGTDRTASAGTDRRTSAGIDRDDPYDSYVTGRQDKADGGHTSGDYYGRLDPSRDRKADGQAGAGGASAAGSASAAGVSAGGAAADAAGAASVAGAASAAGAASVAGAASAAGAASTAGAASAAGAAGAASAAAVSGQPDRHPLDPPDTGMKPKYDRNGGGQTAGGFSGAHTRNNPYRDPYGKQQADPYSRDPYGTRPGSQANRDPYGTRTGSQPNGNPYGRTSAGRQPADSRWTQSGSSSPDLYRYKQVRRNPKFANEDEFQK